MIAALVCAGVTVLMLWWILSLIRRGTFQGRFGKVVRDTNPVGFWINIAASLLAVVTFAAASVALALR